MSVFPPFELEETAREQKRRRFRRVPIRILIPNVITLLALCSGMTAMRFAFEGRFEWAVACIMIATVFDGLDGRIARLLKGTTKFGAELDSLADFVNFGVAPAVVLYLWALDGFKAAGWIVALGLALCAALRLARFNVALDDPDKPAWMANYFTGTPAPAGALLALLPMYLGFLFDIGGDTLRFLVLLYTPLVAFLMVSRIPTFSGKLIGQKVRRDMVLPILICAVLFTAMLLSFPWIMLSVVSLTYLAVIPLSAYRHHRLSQRSAEAVPEKDDEAEIIQ
jgi:CDP-diacylglycerol--serine O-phosphatidyltransferase